MSKHFVLIHGAWHGGWCWNGVIDFLEQAGHTAEAPTMPGHAPGEERDGVTMSDYVGCITGVLSRQEKPVVLVGHSSAGFLLQQAALALPHKIEHLVFHNAFILRDLTAQFDLVPPEAAMGMTAAAKASPDQTVPIDEDFVRQALMAGDPVEKQDALIRRLVPQPIALFTTKVRTAGFSGLDIPKTVLFCKEDASLPPGSYLGMAENLGDYKLVELEGGHETLYVNPAVVGQGLLDILAQA